jgi:hypothetical protein
LKTKASVETESVENKCTFPKASDLTRSGPRPGELYLEVGNLAAHQASSGNTLPKNCSFLAPQQALATEPRQKHSFLHKEVLWAHSRPPASKPAKQFFYLFNSI